MSVAGPVVVFLGPTLAAADARHVLDALYLPPVSLGDVYRIARERPRAIGIIDGYFERVPAVWHKEILWAIERGVPVFGASSMGALRASELAPFGMTGVGAVFEQYRDGILEDDDEVAVAHGDAESGYRAASVAMVNIRATLRRAVRAGVITSECEQTLVAVGKSLFYADRNYPRLLAEAKPRLAASEFLATSHFLEHTRVDQKREDALLLLRELRSARSMPVAPRHERALTDAFKSFQRWADEQPSLLPGSSSQVAARRVCAELRLVEVDPGPLVRAALARVQAHLSAQATRGAPVDEDPLTSLRVREEALAALNQRFRPVLDLYLTDELRAQDRYSALHERALEKQRYLEARGLETPTERDTGYTPDQLLGWYFRDCLRREPPDEIASYLLAAGLRSLDDLLLEAGRELLFQRSNPPHTEPARGYSP